MKKPKPKPYLTICDVMKIPYYRRAAELMKQQFEEREKMVTEFFDGFLFKEATMEKRQTLPGGNPRSKTLTVIPTFDNVLVRRDEATDRSPGGILIPDTGKEKPKRGIVVAVGPGREDKNGCWIAPPCKRGDTVFVRHWNGADILIDNVAHEIFNSAEVIAVETDDKEKIQKAYGK